MNNYTKLMLLGAMEGKNIQNTPLVLTATTTGAETLTLQTLTIATGKTVVVDWGDGNSNSYTGTGTRTHAYAGAGTWTVKFTNRIDITEIDFRDAKFGGVINGANPLPINLTYLRFQDLSGLTYNINNTLLPSGLNNLSLINLLNLTYNANTNPFPSNLTSLYLNYLPNLTYNVNTNPFPSGLIYLYLWNLPNMTWIINAAQPWPAGAPVVEIVNCPNVTCTAWTRNNTQSIRAENGYNETNVDAFVNAVWANKANFTYANPSLDLLGGSNVAPSGTFQAASPPTTGKEKLYDLAHGNYTPAGPEWTVQFQGM